MKRGEQGVQFEQQMSDSKHQKIGLSGSQGPSDKTPEPITQPKIFLQDTLARLFEADKECAAVYIDNAQLVITTNKSHEKLPGLKHHKTKESEDKYAEYIQNVIGLICLNKEGRFDDGNDTLEKICWHNLRAEKGSINFSLSYKDETDKDKILKIINIAKKYAFLSKSQQPTYEMVLAEMDFPDKAMAKLKGAYIHSYCIIRRVLHDLKRAQKLVESQNMDLKILQLTILYFDQENVHAEMRLLGHILREIFINKTNKFGANIYIGISKLCCSQCERVIMAVNVVLQQQLQIEHKGYHGESYTNTVLPEFLSINEELFLKINAEYDKLNLARDDKQYYFYGTRALQSSSSLPSSPASGPAQVESAEQIVDKIQNLRQSLLSSHFAKGLSTWATQLDELEAQVRQLSEDNVILPSAEEAFKKDQDHQSESFNPSPNSP